MSILDFVSSASSATLHGTDKPIQFCELREAQVSLCAHAPAIQGGLKEVSDVELRWFKVEKPLSFTDADELLAVGNPFPSYRQLIAHLSSLNQQLRTNQPVPPVFETEDDIVIPVQLSQGVQWLCAAVDYQIGFACLPATRKQLEPGVFLLYAA